MRVEFRELRREDASAVHDLKVRSRDHLTRLGSWVIPDDYAVADVEDGLTGGEYPKRGFGVWDDERLVGVVSLTAVTEESWSIGYYLDRVVTGHGLATQACLSPIDWSVNHKS